MTRLFAFDSGGCDGCAMEVASLRTGIFALENAGFEFVSSPQQADWLVVTGVLTRRMVPDLYTIWQAMSGRICLVALGDCAIAGGPFGENYASQGGLASLSQTCYRLPGCPPSPTDVLAAFRTLEADIASASLSESSLSAN